MLAIIQLHNKSLQILSQTSVLTKK